MPTTDPYQQQNPGFFGRYNIPQQPYPEPPGYGGIRAAMMNRYYQQMLNPYGMSGNGMGSRPGFQPWSPYGGSSYGGGYGGYGGGPPGNFRGGGGWGGFGYGMQGGGGMNYGPASGGYDSSGDNWMQDPRYRQTPWGGGGGGWGGWGGWGWGGSPWGGQQYGPGSGTSEVGVPSRPGTVDISRAPIGPGTNTASANGGPLTDPNAPPSGSGGSGSIFTNTGANFQPPGGGGAPPPGGGPAGGGHHTIDVTHDGSRMPNTQMRDFPGVPHQYRAPNPNLGMTIHAMRGRMSPRYDAGQVPTAGVTPAYGVGGGGGYGVFRSGPSGPMQWGTGTAANPWTPPPGQNWTSLGIPSGDRPPTNTNTPPNTTNTPPSTGSYTGENPRPYGQPNYDGSPGAAPGGSAMLNYDGNDGSCYDGRRDAVRALTHHSQNMAKILPMVLRAAQAAGGGPGGPPGMGGAPPPPPQPQRPPMMQAPNVPAFGGR